MSAASIASLTKEQRHRLLRELPNQVAEALLADWEFWARPEQIAPAGDWVVWLVLAGRGWGKTRSAAEWIRTRTADSPRIALVGATAADVRDVMVEGESGILSVFPAHQRPRYEPSKRRVVFRNGAVATTYSADEPERLRGPQHHLAWADEIAAWRYPEAWDQLMFGLRLGSDPRVVATTTPKPLPLIRELLARQDVAVSRGSTYENAANLAPAFLSQILQRYEGTRLGRQELHAEVLDDVPGALWSYRLIDDVRVRAAPEMARVVVAVDPAVTAGEDSDMTGIVVAGRGFDGHAYVIADRSCKLSPASALRRAMIAYDEFGADRIVAEVNNGGDLVESTLRAIDAHVPYVAVHASRGKRLRAEPVAALYEQGRVHHVGVHEDLEKQMREFAPVGGEGSPDRVDALVYALTELMLTGVGASAQEWIAIMKDRASKSEQKETDV